MNKDNTISKKIWNKMTEDEQTYFEDIKKEFEDKRFVESKILNKVFVPKWLADLEERFSEVPELIAEDLDATSDVDMKDEFINALYGVDEKHESYGRYCKLFWNQRRLAKMIAYDEKMTKKYAKTKKDCSDKDSEDLKSEKTKKEE